LVVDGDIDLKRLREDVFGVAPEQGYSYVLVEGLHRHVEFRVSICLVVLTVR